MLETLFCFLQFLCILELIKVSKNSHNLWEPMNLQYVEEFKGFL